MAIIEGVDDSTVLGGLLYNIRVRLQTLSDHEAQQLLGPAGPRQGYPESDGLGFTAASCEAVYQHFRAHGVLCVRVLTTGHAAALGYAIIAGTTPFGIHRMIERARKQINRDSRRYPGLRFEVLDDPAALTN